ncbi:MAG: serine/threonine protein kinase, partial [Candidatus Marinamargulisbacteria bacterium]
MLNKVLSLSPETALRRTPEPVLLDACFKFAHDDDQPNHLQMGQRQYRIGKQIAKVTAGGGVYSAFEKDLGPVAIKAMVTRTNEQESTANREIAFLQFLGENPYTVTLFDAGKSEKDTIYAVMSLSKEGSLRNFLDHLPETGTELPKQAVIPLLLQIAKALEYCHEKKVIHHDLKPENILFFKHTLLLCDFGTAQYTGSENARAMTGTLP